jgi:Fe2+ or Zn2+ uptake regulation protein
LQKCRNLHYSCIMDPFNTFIQTLKENNMAVTRPRKAVFETLSGHEPQSMGEIIRRLQGKIDRSSVYRSILLFERLHIVQRLHIGWKYKLELTDRYSHHHHHLTCLSCGTLIPISGAAAIEQNIARICRAHNFSPTNHQLEIRGLCQSCRTQPPQQP